MVENLEPVHSGHLDVEQHRVDAVGFESRQGGLPVGSGCHLVALVFQDHPESVPDAGIVVDHQDPSGHQAGDTSNDARPIGAAD